MHEALNSSIGTWTASKCPGVCPGKLSGESLLYESLLCDRFRVEPARSTGFSKTSSILHNDAAACVIGPLI